MCVLYITYIVDLVITDIVCLNVLVLQQCKHIKALEICVRAIMFSNTLLWFVCGKMWSGAGFCFFMCIVKTCQKYKCQIRNVKENFMNWNKKYKLVYETIQSIIFTYDGHVQI